MEQEPIDLTRTEAHARRVLAPYSEGLEPLADENKDSETINMFATALLKAADELEVLGAPLAYRDELYRLVKEKAPSVWRQHTGLTD